MKEGLGLVVSAIQARLDAEDPALTKIKQYFAEGHYVYGTAAAQVTRLCSDPTVMPVSSQWTTPFHDALPKMLTEILMQPGYLDNIWPQLKLVMGTSVGNITWAALIASTIAFFDMLKVICHPGIIPGGVVSKYDDCDANMGMGP